MRQVHSLSYTFYYQSIKLNTELVTAWLYKHCIISSTAHLHQVTRKRNNFFLTWFMVPDFNCCWMLKNIGIFFNMPKDWLCCPQKLDMAAEFWWMDTSQCNVRLWSCRSTVLSLGHCTQLRPLVVENKVLVAPVLWLLPPTAGAAAGKHSHEAQSTWIYCIVKLRCMESVAEYRLAVFTAPL